MNEEIINMLTKNITVLDEKCHSLEIENTILKTENDEKNKFCEHLLTEIDYLKSIINKTEASQVIPKKAYAVSKLPPITIDYKFEYDQLLNDYDINNNENSLIELFNKFPNRHKDILTAIRDDFPENIDELAKKYHFKRDLKLLIKSNKLLENLEDKEALPKKSEPHELIDNYINSFNSNNKTAAYRYVEQALLCFPLTYKEVFIDKIQAYLFDDFDEKFTKIYNNLYETVSNNSTKEKKRAYLDFFNAPIPEIINALKNKIDIRQRALYAIEAMKNKKRPQTDIDQFIFEINKYLTKNI